PFPTLPVRNEFATVAAVNAPVSLRLPCRETTRTTNTILTRTRMSITSVKQLQTVTRKVKDLVERALAESGGLLRLAPCWVPRSFLQPGKRLKLHPDDLYAYGLNRGGIDERWFASTTPCANENRTPDEGLSYVVVGRQRFTLQQAVAEFG